MPASTTCRFFKSGGNSCACPLPRLSAWPLPCPFVPFICMSPFRNVEYNLDNIEYRKIQVESWFILSESRLKQRTEPFMREHFGEDRPGRKTVDDSDAAHALLDHP